MSVLSRRAHSFLSPSLRINQNVMQRVVVVWFVFEITLVMTIVNESVLLYVTRYQVCFPNFLCNAIKEDEQSGGEVSLSILIHAILESKWTELTSSLPVQLLFY